MIKKNVIFIGSFKSNTGDGGTGGQLFACTSLIESDLKNHANFLLIDTTAISIPAPPVYKRFFNVFKRQLQLYKLLLFYRVDTVIAFSSAGLSFIEKGFMLLVSKLFRKRTIFAPRSGITKADYANSKIYRSLIPFIIKNVDIVICQNMKWKLFYQGINPLNNNEFKVIKNWINLEKYEELPTHFDQSAIVNLLYLGWIETYKGIFDLLDAAHLLRSKQVQFNLKIFGSGSEMTNVNATITRLGLEDSVQTLGWANFNKKIEAFNWTDIYVQPSHMEGSPNTILESMALGKPVIGTNIDGVIELLDNGVGMIVEKENPQSLADGLISLIRDSSLQKELRLKGLKRVKQNHSIEVAVSNWKQILNN